VPRNLSPAIVAAIAAPQKSLAWFVELVFLDQTIYAWSGLGNVTPAGPAWDPGATFPYGQEFIGVGWLGQLSNLPQTTEMTAENMRLTLSGIPASLVGDAVNAVRLTGSVTIWLVFLDALNNVIADPLQMWQGQTDVPTLTDGADTCTFEMTVENSLLALNLSSNRRYTTLDQQLDYPGDAGFEMLSAMQDLFLPYPDGTLNGSHNIGGTSQLGEAPSGVNALTITPAGAQKLTVGGSVQMTAVAVYSSGPFSVAGGGPGNETVTAAGLWSTSDPSVATVSNGTGSNLGSPLIGFGDINWGTGGGLITARGRGNCTITFLFGEVSGSLTVSVA
jgi:hypothetical protein